MQLNLVVIILTTLVAISCDGAPFGGPYPAHPDKVDKKQITFQEFFDERLFVSQGTVLEWKLFQDSIEVNSNLTYGEEYQRYNYVIRPDDNKIVVSIWTAPPNLGEMYQSRFICKAGGTAFPPATRWVMINFYPESPAAITQQNTPDFYPQTPQTNRTSPCWVDGDKDGFLDAMSKHFLLAQPNATIEQFDAEAWGKTEVAYAGEIIVDVQNCTYTVTNGSGTYQPKPGADNSNLLEVAEHFETRLGVGPKYVVKYANGQQEQTEISNTQIQGIPSLCP